MISQDHPSLPTANKCIVRAFVHAVNQRAWDDLVDLVAANFERHSHTLGASPIKSRAELIEYLHQECATFPDAFEQLVDLVAEADRVAARHIFSGTQLGPMGLYPASGRHLKAQYLAIYRIETGRIAEAWVEWDSLFGLRQLDLDPRIAIDSELGANQTS